MIEKKRKCKWCDEKTDQTKVDSIEKKTINIEVWICNECGTENTGIARR